MMARVQDTYAMKHREQKEVRRDHADGTTGKRAEELHFDDEAFHRSNHADCTRVRHLLTLTIEGDSEAHMPWTREA